jgi:hypothetical protein
VGDEAATGVTDAIVSDALLSLGIEKPETLTREERFAELTKASVDGRLDSNVTVRLQNLGILPTSN